MVGTRRGTMSARADRGAVAIIVAVFVVVGMILLAFVIDRGRVYVVQAQLQNAVDAGALAGVQEFCLPGGDPIGVAETYAQNNGALDASAVTQTGSNAYINVRASQELDLFFGPFVSTDTVGVAVQATATRQCFADFNLVSDTFSQVGGTGSTGNGIYAAECFDGGGGDYGIVAVGVAATFDCKASYPGWPNNVPPIYAGVGGSVETPIYNASGISVAIAAQSAGLFDASSNPKSIAAGEAAATVSSATFPKVIQDCKNVPTSDISAGASVNCIGGTGSSNTLNVPNGTVSGYLIADGPIVLDSSTDYTGRLIYSRNGDIDLKGDVEAGAIVYAPNGAVTINGSGTMISGQIFAESIQFNGGGQGLGDTTQLPAPGPYRLTQ